MESSDTWTNAQIVQLIKCRFAVENEFNSGSTKKILLWHQVHQELQNNYSFTFSRDEVMRKFSNLMTTYRRIKRRSFVAGKNNSTWEYFDLFENLYGQHYNTIDTVSGASKAQSDGNISTFDPENDFEYYDLNKIESSDIELKTKNSDVLEFLKQESKQDSKYHEELLNIENEKLKIEKRRLEILFSLKDAFVETLKRNNQTDDEVHVQCKKSKIHKRSAQQVITNDIGIHNTDGDDDVIIKCEKNDFIQSASAIISELKPETQKKAKGEILLYLSELLNED